MTKEIDSVYETNGESEEKGRKWENEKINERQSEIEIKKFSLLLCLHS